MKADPAHADLSINAERENDILVRFIQSEIHRIEILLARLRSPEPA
jgi:hypothetical protein